MKDVHFAGSPLGEKEMPLLMYCGKTHTKVKVDGYIPLHIRKTKEQDATKNLVIEFNGCAWHGCRECFKNDNHVVGNRTINVRRWETEERQMAIENEPDTEVKVIWEHDVMKMLYDENSDLYLEHNSTKGELKRKFDLMEDISPIDPRDAFFGG